VVNVSRGGLALLAVPGATKIGESLAVMLEHENSSLSLAGRVVRAYLQAPDGMYGVQFDALPPDTEQELLKLIRALADGRGNGRRQDPRVAARISVRCKTIESFNAKLNDLSRGGMSIRCPRQVQPGSTLVVEFGLADKTELLSIEGNVTHVEALPDGKHLAGLRFVPPTREQRERVEKLLDLLMGLNDLGP
jgi:c-di-GMP-binding flagellar brake protein YcgR